MLPSLAILRVSSSVWPQAASMKWSRLVTTNSSVPSTRLYLPAEEVSMWWAIDTMARFWRTRWCIFFLKAALIASRDASDELRLSTCHGLRGTEMTTLPPPLAPYVATCLRPVPRLPSWLMFRLFSVDELRRPLGCRLGPTGVTLEVELLLSAANLEPGTAW